MIECGVTNKKQQTKVAQYTTTTFEIERVDKESEKVDNLTKIEQSFKPSPSRKPSNQNAKISQIQGAAMAAKTALMQMKSFHTPQETRNITPQGES